VDGGRQQENGPVAVCRELQLLAESGCPLTNFEARLQRPEQTVAKHLCWNFKRTAPETA